MYGYINIMPIFVKSIIRTNMIAQILTPDQIRSCEGRNYNPQTWETMVDRMLTKYGDPVFYLVEPSLGYDYTRYFVEYTLPEGLRLFDSFSYSGGITNGGFYKLGKVDVTKDGKTYADAMDMLEEGNIEEAKAMMAELDEAKHVKLTYQKFMCEGEMVMLGTSKEARAWMTERSKAQGMTFTKG
jgi:hypothetical protein